MEELLVQWVSPLPWPLLAGLIAGCLYVLARGADLLVHEAVVLSRRSGIPKVVVGATVVSLGTTTPETVVSVLAALQGRPGLALGNAVGSIICDTGLILGLACLIAPLPLDRRIVGRQGWIQYGSGLLLVALCMPWADLSAALGPGGRLPRWTGFLLLGLLAGYMYLSVRWTRAEDGEGGDNGFAEGLFKALLKLAAAVALVVGSSSVLIPAVAEAAERLGVPEAVIAATLVAFGTSTPELVTAVTAARRGHGELAVGNVVGADILNVLFVTGAATAATPGGLAVPTEFFTLYFPSMVLILTVFRVGVAVSGTHLRRVFGAVLLGTYLAVTIASYAMR